MVAWIDRASLRELLEKWRFAEVGDPHFQGEVGDHYAEALARKRRDDPDGWTAASKAIGWGPR